eukprot:CAMPEP_0178994392 /NCGR_PEP_ID=MMETSP0795-20121207/7245_1 /TAXON_ID=88552 /ORGANISM="Amoebophrya sp., Strain Ameob2" /LENGTH=569 /DNA_ID=CAMNT_0020686581 /DNA_START=455 /DNA_END=2164 /DNA_ORIENTATION=+
MASDWICSVCLDINWAKNKMCRWGCETINPTLPPDVNPFTPDEPEDTILSKAEADEILDSLFSWGGAGSGSTTHQSSSSGYNHASCSAPRRDYHPSGHMDREMMCVHRGPPANLHALNNGARRTNGHKTVFAGDWICDSCGDLQFARNQSCRVCGAARAKERLLFGPGNHAIPETGIRLEHLRSRQPGSLFSQRTGVSSNTASSTSTRPGEHKLKMEEAAAAAAASGSAASSSAIANMSQRMPNPKIGLIPAEKLQSVDQKENVSGSCSTGTAGAVGCCPSSGSNTTGAPTSGGAEPLSANKSENKENSSCSVVETMLLEVCGALPASHLTGSSPVAGEVVQVAPSKQEQADGIESCGRASNAASDSGNGIHNDGVSSHKSDKNINTSLICSTNDHTSSSPEMEIDCNGSNHGSEGAASSLDNCKGEKASSNGCLDTTVASSPEIGTNMSNMLGTTSSLKIEEDPSIALTSNIDRKIEELRNECFRPSAKISGGGAVGRSVKSSASKTDTDAEMMGGATSSGGSSSTEELCANGTVAQKEVQIKYVLAEKEPKKPIRIPTNPFLRSAPY